MEVETLVDDCITLPWHTFGGVSTSVYLPYLTFELDFAMILQADVKVNNRQYQKVCREQGEEHVISGQLTPKAEQVVAPPSRGDSPTLSQERHSLRKIPSPGYLAGSFIRIYQTDQTEQ